MCRARGYSRISQDDPNVPKVENQNARITALAQAENYDLEHIYQDDGISAYESRKVRPDWDELKRAVEAREFEVLLFDRQDRLARDQFETLAFIAACGRAGIKWHSVDGGLLDLSDPMTVFIAVFRGGEAQAYSKKMSENIKRRNATDRGKGLPRKSGSTPFGWNEDRMTCNPGEAGLIKLGIKMILKGANGHQVVKAWRASGIKPKRSDTWTRIQVVKTMTRWANAGVVEYQDEPTETPGVWDAICTRDELEQVRTILLNRGGVKATAKHMASGLIRCSCGSPMITTGGNKHLVYTCAARQKGQGLNARHASIMKDRLEALVTSAIVTAYLTGDTTDGTDDGDSVADLYSKMAELRAKKSKLVDAFQDDLITKADLAARSARIGAETDAVQTRLDHLINKSAHSQMLHGARAALMANVTRIPVQAPDTTLEFKVMRPAGSDAARTQLVDAFQSLSLDDQRALIKATLDVVVHPGRSVDRVSITPRDLQGVL